jgi:hypothetical protein
MSSDALAIRCSGVAGDFGGTGEPLGGVVVCAASGVKASKAVHRRREIVFLGIERLTLMRTL